MKTHWISCWVKRSLRQETDTTRVPESLEPTLVPPPVHQTPTRVLPSLLNIHTMSSPKTSSFPTWTRIPPVDVVRARDRIGTPSLEPLCYDRTSSSLFEGICQVNIQLTKWLRELCYYFYWFHIYLRWCNCYWGVIDLVVVTPDRLFSVNPILLLLLLFFLSTHKCFDRYRQAQWNVCLLPDHMHFTIEIS